MRMDDPDRPDRAPSPPEDRLAEFLARTRPPAGTGGDAGPCPGPSLLAGFAEGRLHPRERDAAEEHIARCGACRTAVAGLLLDREDPDLQEPAPLPAPRAVLPWRFAAPAAAAALLAAFLLSGIFGTPSPVGTEGALLAAARDVASARPDLFGEFRPLGRGEALPPALAPKRGAMALLSPAGTVLGTRPWFRWEAVPGVARWRVSLRTAEGDPLWSAESPTASLPFPPGEEDLRPGTRYIWEASGEGPLGREGSRRAFDIASAAERRAFEEAGRVIDARAPAGLRPLLRAHFALRRGLYAAAVEEAEAFLLLRPGDPSGREVLAAARRALGEPEGVGEPR